MQWPDIKCGARLSRCSWQLGLKCYPCYFCRGVVAAAAPLAVVEAVTARVSVLPVVGSDLPTGLSAAVGVTEQFVVDLVNTLDKVGHGAGQSCVRIVSGGAFAQIYVNYVISCFLGFGQWPF